MSRRSLAAAGAVVLSAGLLAGCSGREVPVTWCEGEIASVELYNAYADHSTADLQRLTGADAQDWCEIAFPYQSAALRNWPAEEELGTSFRTVAVITETRGSITTVWIDRMPGPRSRTAVEGSDGTRYVLPHAGHSRYWGEEAGQVPASEMPARPP